MNKFGILKKFIWQYKLPTLNLLILNFLCNLTTLIIPILLAHTYSLLFDYQSTRGKILQDLGIPLEHSFQQQLFWFALFILVKGIIDFFRKTQQGQLSEHFLFYLRDTLYRHHLKMDFSIYEKKGISKYLLRFSGDLSSAQRFLAKGILQFTTDAMLVVMSIILISFLDFNIGMIVLTMLSAITIPIYFINKKIRLVEINRRNQKSGLLSFINKSLINIAALKATNREAVETMRFTKRAKRIKLLGRKYYHQAALLELLISTSLYAAIITTFIIIFNIQQSKQIFAADHLFIIVILLLYLRSTLLRLFKVGLVWEKGSISLQKIDYLLQQSTADNYDKAEVKLRRPTLQLEEVALETEGKTLLPSLNFELRAKEVGLIVGKSGSGKSTLVKILANLYAPTHGNIKLDDYNFNDLSAKTIRKQFAFISETIPLYGKNVAEAVVYSTRKRKQALEIYKEWQSIFPELKEVGFYESLHETVYLTPMQIQLLMWFRAVQSNKAFLILDDAFQHLEDNTARLIWEKIPKNTGILILSQTSQIIDLLDVTIDWKINLALARKKIEVQQ